MGEAGVKGKCSPQRIKWVPSAGIAGAGDPERVPGLSFANAGVRTSTGTAVF